MAVLAVSESSQDFSSGPSQWDEKRVGWSFPITAPLHPCCTRLHLWLTINPLDFIYKLTNSSEVLDQEFHSSWLPVEMVLLAWWMTNAYGLLSIALGSGIRIFYCNFKTFWGSAKVKTMQEAKGGAGTTERAELPPSGVVCLSFWEKVGHFVPLENLFL